MDHVPSATNAKKPRPRAVLPVVLFAIYAVVLIGVVLFKFPFQIQLTDSGRHLNLIPFAGSFANPRLGIGEVVENALIFVPYGVYLSMVSGSWNLGKRVLVIAATSVAFETIQFVFGIGRSDITDVLDNTFGGLVGIGIYALLVKILGQRTDRVVSIVALVLTVIALAFFAFLKAHSK
jgi:glycopeptide antibiotics resistance protein